MIALETFRAIYNSLGTIQKSLWLPDKYGHPTLWMPPWSLAYTFVQNIWL